MAGFNADKTATPAQDAGFLWQAGHHCHEKIDKIRPLSLPSRELRAARGDQQHFTIHNLYVWTAAAATEGFTPADHPLIQTVS